MFYINAALHLPGTIASDSRPLEGISGWAVTREEPCRMKLRLNDHTYDKRGEQGGLPYRGRNSQSEMVE